MISYNPLDGQFQITDLGRIAAKYYIRYTTIETFNKEFKPKMSEADVLALLSMSTEVRFYNPFSQTEANDLFHKVRSDTGTRD